MKFNEIKYERVNLKEFKKHMLELNKKFKNANSYEESKKIMDQIDEYTNDQMTTITYANIMNSIDTANEFYDKEVKYYNSALAKLSGFFKKISKDFVNSKFKDDYIKNGYELDVKEAEIEIKNAKKSIILPTIKSSMLEMEYSKIVAQAKTDFNGQSLNFYGLLKEMQNPDRDVRKKALKAWSDLYESISPKLDDIYHKLVQIRCKIAKKLKYPDYQSLVYDQRSIFDYNREDLKKFKDAVIKYIVPECTKQFDEQRKRLGLDHLYFYDESLFFPEGAIVPIGTTEELVEKANQMYNEMSKETGEFFTFMKENQFFDLETKPNKAGGGFCADLPKYKATFIFSNFNGTSADVDVLTHEAGHAFAAYTGFRGEKDIYAQNKMTSDIAEIHSMSMEHFAYPYMEKFFEEKADKYRYYHLTTALTTIPYLCAVDEFQTRVYQNPNATPNELRAMWHDIEKIFLPWRDYDDCKFLNEGGFWMQKQHIFLYPFYYIDYALSQICAFQFYQRETINHEETWKDYYKLCQIAGKQGYLKTLELVNLKSPFDENTIKETIDFIVKKIDELKTE